jgi:hypothetical protein
MIEFHTIKCLRCGKRKNVQRPNAKYCSGACKQAYYRDLQACRSTIKSPSVTAPATPLAPPLSVTAPATLLVHRRREKIHRGAPGSLAQSDAPLNLVFASLH